MAKKEKKTDEDAEDEGGGSKLKLIIGAVVLVVVGAVLGGKVLGGGGGAASAGPVTTTTEPPGMVTTLDPITLNLVDGRFLKVGIGFEVHHDEVYPDPDHAAADSLTIGFAREIDAAIEIFGTFSYEDLIAPTGKTNVKRMLLDEVQRISDGAIRDVFFTQFVMQ